MISLQNLENESKYICEVLLINIIFNILMELIDRLNDWNRLEENLFVRIIG